MTVESYSIVYGDVFRAISAKLEQKHDDARRFVPRGTIPTLFEKKNHTFLRRIFQSISAEVDDEDPLTISHDVIDTYIERVEDRKLSTLLGTLIFSGCSIGAARAVIRRFIVPSTITDEETALGQLPLSPNLLNRLFTDTNDVDKFTHHQSWFCPIILIKGEATYLKEQHGRLPYISEDIQGEGSFGKVYRVEIAKNHFRNRQGNEKNRIPEVVARKDYHMSEEGDDPRKEFDTMKQIIQSPVQHENILQSLGFLRIGNNSSLFMPLAKCDLKAYMYDKPAPDPATKIEMINCAKGLADGLNHLHRGIRTHDSTIIVCYHMDLNPTNILVFHEGDRKIWKISDFGMSRIKIRAQNTAQNRTWDFNGLFLRRKPPENKTLSATLNRRGDGTYLAPESMDSPPAMTIGSDVWSLGCIMSVLFAYLDSGWVGVESYAIARRDHPKAGGLDKFFVPGRLLSPTAINPSVTNWHRQLVSRAEQSSAAGQRIAAEGEVIRNIRRFLEGRVLLVDPRERCSAAEITKELDEARKLLQISKDKTPLESPSNNNRFRDIFDTLPIYRPTSRRDRIEPLIAHIQPPNSLASAFKGCCLAPDGNSLAYWTDSDIILFTGSSLSFTNTETALKPEKWSLNEHPNLDRETLTLKHICLTDRYLVASVVGRSYIYVFHLPVGRSDGGALQRWYRLPIDFPGADEVAISLNNQTLALVARNSTSMDGNATLVYMQMRNIMAIVDVDSSLVSTERPALTPILVDLNWPASEISQLSVSNESDVHFVVRRRLTVRSRKLATPVVHVSLDPSRSPPAAKIHQLNMDSQGFDVATTAGFFTTFCPLKDDKSACAVITRTKRLHIESFAKDTRFQRLEADILDYRVTKLVCSGVSGTLLALGHTSSDQKMLLLRMQTVPTLTITRLCVLPGLMMGDGVSFFAVNLDDEETVFVVGLTGSSGKTIYKVHIPHSSR